MTNLFPKLHNAMWPGLVGKGDEEGQEAEQHTGVDGLSTGEHVVSPHQRADDGDREAGEGDALVLEDRALPVDSDHLNAHT